MSDKEMIHEGDLVFFHTSGENISLGFEEIMGTLRALELSYELLYTAPQITLIKAIGNWVHPEIIINRTGMVYGIYRSLLSLEDIDHLDNLKEHRIVGENDLIKGGSKDIGGSQIEAMINSSQFRFYIQEQISSKCSFKIEVERIRKGFGHISKAIFRNKLGQAIKDWGGSINLDSPDVTIDVILSRNIYLGIPLVKSNRGRILLRKCKHLPFTKPISLSPIFSRVLINMAEIKKGDKVLDPFCGTGSTLSEVSQIGGLALGSDVDTDMIEGAYRNFEYLGLPNPTLKVCDISEITEFYQDIDAVITDPPYARSTTTTGMELVELFRIAFNKIEKVLKKGGKFSLILPSLEYLQLLPDSMNIQSAVSHRVHRSLVRHFISIRKC